MTEEIEYLSAIEEGQYVIAQANASLDEAGRFIDDLVTCRHRNEATLTPPDRVRVHGRVAAADRLGGGGAHPVP